MTITPKEQTTPDEAKLNAEANPDLDEGWKENFEQRYKDTQSAFTKAQQEKIEMARMLVETDPANIRKIADEKVRNKIIQEKWNVETLDQLEYIHPDFAKKPNNDWDDEELSDVEKLKREMKLLKLQTINTKTKEALWEVKVKYAEVIKTIPDFEQKLQTELKYISEGIEPKDRIEKAFKLVVNNETSTADAFSIMQWIDNWWTKIDKKEKENKEWSPLDEAFRNALSNG